MTAGRQQIATIYPRNGAWWISYRGPGWEDMVDEDRNTCASSLRIAKRVTRQMIWEGWGATAFRWRRLNGLTTVWELTALLPEEEHDDE